MSSRVRRYTITMAFRTACFIAMVFVDGPLRWVLFACAVILPYIAVIAANQAKLRGQPGKVGTGRAHPATAAHHRGTGRCDPRVAGRRAGVTR